MKSDWREKALELFPEMRSEIESVNQLGRFWVDLSTRFRYHYLSDARDSEKTIRSICLYAIWCTRSESLDIQEPALIEFYQGLPRFAIHSKPSIYKRIIEDLVANLGIAEIEKRSGEIGFYLQADEKKKFLVDTRQAESERQKCSRKR
jgi:hypothetical protein